MARSTDVAVHPLGLPMIPECSLGEPSGTRRVIILKLSVFNIRFTHSVVVKTLRDVAG